MCGHQAMLNANSDLNQGTRRLGERKFKVKTRLAIIFVAVAALGPAQPSLAQGVKLRKTLHGAETDDKIRCLEGTKGTFKVIQGKLRLR
jgi:hypothetical protein